MLVHPAQWLHQAGGHQQGSELLARLVTRSRAEARLVEPLGRLYFEAYDPGVACDSLADAVADIAASFDGAYGDFWFESSPLVEENGQIVAALMTVLCAPWEDTPDCPFIIELFTARTHRRQGFARLLISRCMSSAFEAGEESVALRVVSSNTSALTMYEALGFSTWSGSKEAGG